MARNGFRVVVFDVDGTLTDFSESDACLLTREMVARNDFLNRQESGSIPREGIRIDANWIQYLAQAGYEMSDPAIQEAFIQLLFAEFSGRFRLHDWVPELIEKISAKMELAILSNNSRRSVKKYLGPHLKKFRQVITCDDGLRPKPRPDGLVKICSYAKVEPRQVLFIGDSTEDMLAAFFARTAAGLACFNQGLAHEIKEATIRDLFPAIVKHEIGLPEKEDFPNVVFQDYREILEFLGI